MKVKIKKPSRKSLNDLNSEGQTLSADGQYNFGTGMALDASQVLLGSVLQGLNGIFSKNKGNADGNIFDSVPQEGQIMALGGGVTPANTVGSKVGTAINTTLFDPQLGLDFLNLHANQWGNPNFTGGNSITGLHYNLNTTPNSTNWHGDGSTYEGLIQPVMPTPKVISASEISGGRTTRTPDTIHSNNFAMGGEIKIKPSHKGRFTAWAKEHSMSVSEAASHVMANKGKYSPKVVKMANFAHNFAALGDSSLQPINPQDQQNVPVEVEGNEVAQMPNGQVGQFSGPSHEDGGVQANLPQGTKIYSDRLSIDGKTMQKRKLSREKSISKLTGMLDKNPTDALNRNTYNRMKARANMEEQQDLMMQDAASQIYNKVSHLDDAEGGFQTPQANQQEQYQQQQDMGQVQPAGMQRQFASGTGQDGVNPYHFNLPNTSIDFNSLTPYRPDYIDSGKTPENFNNNFPITLPITNINNSPKNNTDMPYSTGDELGFMGNAISGFGPLATTIANRAGDKPNVNAFKNFGNNAIDANSQGMGFLNIIKDNALKDSQMNTTGQRVRNRNSASSVGTARALDLATSGQQDISDNNIYSSYAQQMAGMYNEKSKLYNQQDLYKDTGAQTADREDRMDRDSYYTNLAQNLGNIGHTTQQTGKELNEHDYNNQILSLMPYLNKYGLGYTYDENGKPIQVKVN